MQTTPLRAARLPGRSTLWTRTLDRLLRRPPERGPKAGLSSGGAPPLRHPPADTDLVDAGLVDAGRSVVLAELRRPAGPPRPAAARRTWTAPRHLPELLTMPRIEHRPGAHFAAAR